MKWLIKQVGVKDCDDCQTSYRFINPHDRIYQTHLRNYSYTISEPEVDVQTGYKHDVKRAQIFPDGKFIVYKGAGSDGCTPVYLLFNRKYIGVPNGRLIQTESGVLEPITAEAFYPHDWLLKMSKAAGIPKADIHDVFCEIISKRKFWLRKRYCDFVRSFGPKD